tara:strand:- start:948 stop:1697 length:750 start_codon:yes stop_codon:yes gene_type:complete
MKIVASIQVRMGSTRFPGKAMYEISSKPLLGYLISRLKKSKLLDDIVVATSTNKENDVIENYCKKNNISCYRGDEEDVLSRILESLEYMNATIGVEVFGDCPLIDPIVVDYIINEFLNDINDLDFVGNDLKTTFPPGMEVEVFKLSTLKDSNDRVNDKKIREHGTLFIRQNPNLYKIKNIVAPEKWNYPELELEVDTKEDIIVISEIFNYFQNNDSFGIDDIIKFLINNPKINNINKNVPRRWKMIRGE